MRRPREDDDLPARFVLALTLGDLEEGGEQALLDAQERVVAALPVGLPGVAAELAEQAPAAPPRGVPSRKGTVPAVAWPEHVGGGDVAFRMSHAPRPRA